MAEKGKTWGSLAALAAAVIATTFAVEKGWVNNPADPGGETNHGITQNVARANGYKGDMRELPKEFAEWVYAKDYIEKPQFDRVLALSPAVGHKLVDAGVNAGPGRAAKWFQQALNDLSRGGADYGRISVDGQIGAGTLAAYQALERKRGRTKACELVVKLVDARQAMHYVSLNMPTFTVGWVDHRIGLVPLSRCTETVAKEGA